MDIKLVKFNEDNLKEIYKIGFREDTPEWKKWDGPYFDDDYKKYHNFNEFLSDKAEFFINDGRRCILYKNKPIGIVTMYWEDKKTRWLNIGITIYEEKYWNKKIGSYALKLWISFIFKNTKNLEHIGLVTWSGNKRMMKAASKIGMIKEGQIRKVRFYNNYFYDSLYYGIVKDEWKAFY